MGALGAGSVVLSADLHSEGKLQGLGSDELTKELALERRILDSESALGKGISFL